MKGSKRQKPNGQHRESAAASSGQPLLPSTKDIAEPFVPGDVLWIEEDGKGKLFRVDTVDGDQVTIVPYVSGS